MPKPVCAIGLFLASLLLFGCTEKQVAIQPTPSPPPSPSPSPVAMPDDPVAKAQVKNYLEQLNSKFPQGIWLQTMTQPLAEHDGSVSLSVASITKVATALAALQILGPDYRYTTEVWAGGPINNGVLQGDLIIKGGSDPLFIWEEAIPVGNMLNQLGIRQVTGNLVVVDRFHMNFEVSPVASGELFKQAINQQLWNSEVELAHNSISGKPPQPMIEIRGRVRATNRLPPQAQLLLRHYSPPLIELVKKMNMYSNNPMAEVIAESIGGPGVISQKSIQATGLPESEISIVNGSGLSDKNRISARAATAIFISLAQFVESKGLTIADTMAIIGQDAGVLDWRKLPPQSVLKSGTLNTVSALGGVVPTKQKGLVWFTVINTGTVDDIDRYRKLQDEFLTGLQELWGKPDPLPSQVRRTVINSNSRIDIIYPLGQTSGPRQ